VVQIARWDGLPEFDSCARKSLIHIEVAVKRATTEGSTECLALVF
jgi:hypothetical protein